MFYFSLIVEYYLKQNDYEKDIKLLVSSYYLSLFYGIIRMVSFNFSIPLKNIFLMVEKRSSQRLSFSFTEPSFISMHVFGILLILYLISKNEKNKRNILFLIILFSFLTIINNSSARFVVDFLVILFIILIFSIFISKSRIFKKAFFVFLLIFFVGMGMYLINTNPRLNKIVEMGIYADGSLASRWFRVNASIKGYFKAPLRVYTGAGLGNAYVFLNLGYNDAFSEYKSSYMVEVYQLYNTTHNQFFSMPIRLISEFGIFIFLLIITYFIYIAKKSNINNKYLILFIFFYLYIQFDSYAFYTLWLVLFTLKYSDFLKLTIQKNYKLQNFNK